MNDVVNAIHDVTGATNGATLAPTPERRLSFAFAKRHGVVVKQFVDGTAETFDAIIAVLDICMGV